MELLFYTEWHVGESAVIFLGVLGNEAAFAAERRKETQLQPQAGPWRCQMSLMSVQKMV